MEEAAKLYSGELLEGLGIENDEFESWRREEARHFKDQAIDVLTRLMTQLSECGETEGAIAAGARLLRLEPLHEPATRRLVERLYPLGVDAIVEAVAAVAAGTARGVPQDESRATAQGLANDAMARIDWARSASELDRLIRGCDPQPGAFALLRGEKLRLFDGRLLAGTSDAPAGSVLGLEAGRLVLAARGGRLGVGRLRLGEGKKQLAGEAGLEAGQRLE